MVWNKVSPHSEKIYMLAKRSNIGSTDSLSAGGMIKTFNSISYYSYHLPIQRTWFSDPSDQSCYSQSLRLWHPGDSHWNLFISSYQFLFQGYRYLTWRHSNLAETAVATSGIYNCATFSMRHGILSPVTNHRGNKTIPWRAHWGRRLVMNHTEPLHLLGLVLLMVHSCRTSLCCNERSL